MKWLKKIKKEVISSVRLVDVEERFDLVFSRPAGLLFARLAARLSCTPTQVSVASMLIGVLGGVLFLWQDHWQIAWIAAFLVVLAGVLDSSDGQLARMTGQSSELGRIIDGIADNLVFISMYLFSAFYLFDEYGPWISLGLGSLAGAAHSWKSAVYEFHKQEYFYYVGGFKSSRIPFAKEVSETYKRDTLFQKFIYAVYYDYCKKQEKNAFRSPDIRVRFDQLAYDPSTRTRFVAQYASLNKSMLFWWAWVGGSNIQRNAMIIAMLLNMVEFYFLLNALSMIVHWWVGAKQISADRTILQNFER